MTASYGRQGAFRGWDRFDYLLVLAALALVGFGLALIYSGSISTGEGSFSSINSPVTKQVVSSGLSDQQVADIVAYLMALK